MKNSVNYSLTSQFSVKQRRPRRRPSTKFSPINPLHAICPQMVIGDVLVCNFNTKWTIISIEPTGRRLPHSMSTK